MKLHFEDCFTDERLAYQREAIEAVCDLFAGQEICRSDFTVSLPAKTPDGQDDWDKIGTAAGYGNRLQLLNDEILNNLHKVQLRNGLRPDSELRSGDFTVEMETGTGKTYVYLRTIFELNKRYGFTKFVIVVPSVAIKEGVYKTLQITRDHFEVHYPGTKGYEFFLYDSSKMGDVRNFATSSTIQIMVVTVGAINKKEVNNLYKDSERTGDEKPIDLIKATRPVIIVDEPQTVDGGLQGSGKQALEAMEPLCTLRYSATHVDKHHMVYRLDAVDAYERQLVKQISVASLLVEDAYNKPYVRLVETRNTKNVITARVELDIDDHGRVKRKEVTVQDGDDLEQVTGRALYANYRIGEIHHAQRRIELKMPKGEEWLEMGQAINEVDPDDIKRLMIRRTIKAHLEKELQLRPQGIKVLSLFFIDSVEHYRSYDVDGNPVRGKYARMFEEEYRRLAKLSDYQSLFGEVDLASEAAEVHDGYFSIDKNKRWTDTAENNQSNRDSAERAYNLIMREKEKLLSFASKLKFIFSHSALREGWDNPNVFQICALRDMQSEQQRRQTIGRGLRLCVNQNGDRLRGFDINTLTVVATESYEEFAENLQREIEADTGIRFGIVEKHQFANVAVVAADGSVQPMGVEQSEVLWNWLKAESFIDAKGKVQDALRAAIKEGSITLPAEFSEQQLQIVDILRKLAGKLDIKNEDDRRTIKTRRAVLDSPEFAALWDRIKHKTAYRVEFNNEKLIQECIRLLDDEQQYPPITPTRVISRTAKLTIGKGGVSTKDATTDAPINLVESNIELPDLLTDLQDKTHLTRKSLVRILTECQRLKEFKRNPQQFIEMVSDAVNRTKRAALVDGIRYRKLGDTHYYAQELFESNELTGYLKQNMLAVTKSVYEYVVYDSAGVEQNFAKELEGNPAVKVFAKLPAWFKVPTPLGNYNPDWAVLIEEQGKEQLYFVVETKGSLFNDALRNVESAKIQCGKEHFKVLADGQDAPAKYITATTLDDVFKKAQTV